MLFAAVLTILVPITLHDFKPKDIDGHEHDLARYKGKVVLVVNVASKCGLTPQYEQLQSIYVKYEKQGFVVLGFPCNDFGSQEPGSEGDIKKFCTANYSVTFPMFAKVSVKGQYQGPLYKWLIAESGGKDIEWNFAKFLIAKNGKFAARFASRTRPDDPVIVASIQKELAATGS